MKAAPARAGLARLAAGAAPAAILLAGCSTIENFNPLAALDGRYVRSGERATTEDAQPIDLTPPAPGQPAPPTQTDAPAEQAPTPAAASDEALAPPPPADEPDPEPAPPVLAVTEPDAPVTEEPAPTDAAEAPPSTVAETFADLGEDEASGAPPALAVADPVEPPLATPTDSAPLPPPAPVAASDGRARPVGPQLVAEQPVTLETRIASAFDLAQQEAEEIARAAPAASSARAPATASPTREDRMEQAAEELGLTVATRMPAPGEAVPRPTAAGQGPWHDFTQWALDRLGENPAGGARESMLLLDPPAIDPALMPCGNMPPAVLIDLDPANGLLPLVATERQHPALAADLAQLRRRGVTIYWISGHGPEAASAIRKRLAASGLDPDGVDPLIVTRFAGESKQARRYGLGESNCLLAIAGDHRADFDELYDYVLDPIMAAPLEGHVGHGWFIAPPPLD